MNKQLEREALCNGVYFNNVTDSKFKHNRITVSLLTDLNAQTAADNAVVPYILRKGSAACPDFTKLNQKLCALYGASLSCGVSKYGGCQSLELSIYGVDDRFTLSGEKMIAECAALLTDVLLAPNMPGGLFSASDVELEKQQVIDEIESLLNEKRAYALSRCKSEMCAGEPIAIEKHGGLEQARAITAQKASDAYRRLLETAQIEIIFTGCGNPAAAREIFTKAFQSVKRAPTPLAPLTARAKEQHTPREVVESFEVAQGKLVLGLRVKMPETPEQFAAMRLMTAVYGGTPNSRLFTQVREKHSLCYYCAARYERLSGLMFVDSGIEIASKQKAQEEILRQLEIMQQGGFIDEELTAAKLLLCNSLQSVGDSLGAIEDWSMSQIMAGTNDTPAQEAALLEAVTREQVIEAAKTVWLDTIYFLTGKEKPVELVTEILGGPQTETVKEAK